MDVALAALGTRCRSGHARLYKMPFTIATWLPSQFEIWRTREVRPASFTTPSVREELFPAIGYIASSQHF